MYLCVCLCVYSEMAKDLLRTIAVDTRKIEVVAN